MRLVSRCALALSLVLVPQAVRADSPAIPLPPSALAKSAPESIEDLKAIQEQTKAVLKKVLPSTVGLMIGGAAGSGVIVNADGTILTAGHVSGDANREVTVFLSDGRRVKGKTLGANRSIDSGMIKITDKGPWPFVEIGMSADLQQGEWVIATGHPGGYQRGRTPPVRLGRVGMVTRNVVQTDCTLVGGDSGGPLFNMQGKVIGIHSRISGPITQNIHVPVDTYTETWDRLAKAEIWGFGFGGGGRGARNPDEGYLGVECQVIGKACTVIAVTNGSPAEKAGLKAGDVILRFEETDVKDWDHLGSLIAQRKQGQDVAIDVKRGEEELTLRAKIGRKERR